MDETDISDVFTRLICKLPGQTFHFVVATCIAAAPPSASRYEISKLRKDRKLYFPLLRREEAVLVLSWVMCEYYTHMWPSPVERGKRRRDGELGSNRRETNNVKERLENEGTSKRTTE